MNSEHENDCIENNFNFIKVRYELYREIRVDLSSKEKKYLVPHWSIYDVLKNKVIYFSPNQRDTLERLKHLQKEYRSTLAEHNNQVACTALFYGLVLCFPIFFIMVIGVILGKLYL